MNLRVSYTSIFRRPMETYSDVSTTLITVRMVNLFCSQNIVPEQTKFTKTIAVL